jgi:large exoprotein involved in heme utilization and adhesion
VFNDTEPGSVGRSGNININVGNLRIFDGALLRTSSAGQGDGGNITVRAGTLDMRSGAELSSSTFGPGNAGNINLELSNWGYLEGGGTSLFSNIEAGAVGNGGQINLIAPGLALVNGAQIQAGIRGSFSSLLGGQGNAGRVTIQTQNLAIIGQDGELRSGIFNDAESGSAGRSGDIYIIAEAFRLSDGGILRSRNLGLGDGGDIVIATDVLEVLNESRLDTSIQRSGNTGNAGNVVILASDRVTFSNSNMFSTVEARAVGNSGNIIIDTRLLEVLDGSQLQVLVRGSAALAGVIQITASDRVIFAGISPDGQFPSGAFGSVEGRGVGVGGNINITTDVLEVRDGALLSVRSLSPTGVAGNLEITAREVRLNNGRLDAETEFSPQNVAGANISLRGLELLLMENDSLISARARSAANGGNISIDASNGFVIGIPNENNDIIATAEAGDGGNIIIRANRIFGFTDQTDAGFTFSQLRSNITSDISASSQFGTQGSVALDVIAIDPTQGLTALPDALVDVTNQIGQVCPTGPDAEDQLGSFIITGRGGIAPSPLDVMDGRAVDAGWVDSELDESGEAEAEDGDKGYGEAQTVAEAQTLTEAQRWVVDTDGHVHLVAGSHSASSPATIPARCPSPNRIVIER